MKKRRFLQGLLICFLLLGVSLIPARRTEAAVQKAPGYARLNTGVIYRNVDVTGDRKADTFSIQRYINSVTKQNTGILIKINGRAVYQFKGKHYEKLTAGLLTLKNGKPFVYLYAQSSNGDGPVCGVFQYRSGRFDKIIDFQTLMGQYGIHESGRVRSYSASKSTITTRFSLMSWSLGNVEIDYRYVYKNGTLKRASTVGSIRRNGSTTAAARTLNVNRTLYAYKKPGSKTRAYVLKRGNKVILTGRCWLNGGQLYFEVSRNGVKGWLKAYTSQPRTTNRRPFSNVTYAG